MVLGYSACHLCFMVRGLSVSLVFRVELKVANCPFDLPIVLESLRLVLKLRLAFLYGFLVCAVVRCMSDFHIFYKICSSKVMLLDK